MAYPTVQFEKVFKSVLRATGRPDAVISLMEADELEEVAGLVNDAVLEYWEYDFWPGTFATEQRGIDSDEKYILKESTGETEIGIIDPEECFYAEQPAPNGLKEVLSGVEDQGDRIVCFDPDCPEEPYIRFQLPCPVFTREVYVATTTYERGALTYDATTGESYKSLQAGNIGKALSDTAWWARVLFPKMAEVFVKWAASSEWMSEDDGKYKQSARARRELDRLEERYLPALPVGR